MLGVGLAFKLSAFPFHFWCPDVFEGASAEVDSFLSVASKAAALALLVRVVVGFTTLPTSQPGNVPLLPGGTAVEQHDIQAADAPRIILASAVEPAKQAPEYTKSNPTADSKSDSALAKDPLSPARSFIVLLLSLIAAMTCTFGNLAAYGQTNLKRLMAYSTIAHAGYIMMPVAAAVALGGVNQAASQAVFAVVPFYVGLYLFMNLGAFAIIAFLRNATHSEEIADYGGLVRVAPGVVVCLTIIFVSLIGIPPMAGFAAKYVAFASLVQAMTEAPLFRGVMLSLLVVGGLNTALSLFYYLRVIKTMAIDPEPADRPAVGFSLVSLPGAYVVLMTIPVVVLGVFWNQFFEWLRAGASNLM